MKTLDEAFECLKRQPGEEEFVVNVDVDNGVATAQGAGEMSAGMASLAALAVEVAENEKIADLRTCMISVHLQRATGAEDGQSISVPEEMGELMDSLFTTGIAYGIRLGMEMEKADL